MHDESQHILSEAIKGLGPEYMEILPKELTIYCSSIVWLKGAKPDVDIEQKVIPILLALQERYPDVYMNHATEITAWQVLKNWNKVIEACKKTLAKFPDEETTMLAMAMAYDKIGKQHHALHSLGRAIGISASLMHRNVLRHLAPIQRWYKALSRAENKQCSKHKKVRKILPNMVRKLCWTIM
jgi:tetratricopeptide (TPR) repeat protein